MKFRSAYGINDHMNKSLELYINHGCDPGHFLKAVLSNDLFDAVGRADIHSTIFLPLIVSYIYNELPSGCHGSREIVKDWMKLKQEEMKNREEES